MARGVLPEPTFEEDLGRLSNGWGSVFRYINPNAECHVFDQVSGGTFPWRHGAVYKRTFLQTLEHCVECPAASAWKLHGSIMLA